MLDVQDSDQDLVPLSRRPQSSGVGPVLQGKVLLPSDWGAGVKLPGGVICNNVERKTEVWHIKEKETQVQGKSPEKTQT